MIRVTRYAPSEVPSCRPRPWRGGTIGPDDCGRVERVRPAGQITYLPPATLAAAGRLPYSFIVEATTPVTQRVEMLRRLVEQDLADPRIVVDLAKITSQCVRLSDGTPRGIAQAILDWQAKHIAYEYDPGDLEVFQSPRYTLARGAADCEDKASLVVALAKLAGLEAHSCWVSQPRARNNHVAPRVCLQSLNGASIASARAPWDYDQSHDRYDLEVTCPAPLCELHGYVWAEATLKGARVGEHPYDVLRRLREIQPTRAHL